MVKEIQEALERLGYQKEIEGLDYTHENNIEEFCPQCEGELFNGHCTACEQRGI